MAKPTQTIVWGECAHDGETYFVGIGPKPVYKLCECVDETAAMQIASALHQTGKYDSIARIDSGDE